MPAWLEREGQQTPLKVGATLVSTDQIRTGTNGRILLSLQDGSKVKLGENGTLIVEALIPENDLFTATLNVLKGAFRFTTDLVIKNKRRDVKVLIGTATIGIRGTDVWGKADEEKDIVCLLEGKINVNRGTDKPVLMQEPLTFYVAPKGQPAQAVAAVPLDNIKQWAQQTDIQVGTGATRLGGQWKLYLLSSTDQKKVLKAYDILSSAGYAVEMNNPLYKGKTVFRLRIVNLPNKKESKALAKYLEDQPGLGEMWISKN